MASKAIAALTSVLVILCLAQAASGASVSIQPAEGTMPEVGATVRVDILATDLTDLGAFDIQIDYPPDAVTIASDADLELGSALPTSGDRVFSVVNQTIDNDNGALRFAAFSYRDGAGPSGPVTVAHITFTAKQAVTAHLNLHDVTLTDTQGAVMEVSSENDADLLLRSNYTITAESNAYGTIDPAGEITVKGGDDQTFTITPAAGCVIEDVMVDGVSVGAVSSHTIENVSDNLTIEAKFAVGEMGLADLITILRVLCDMTPSADVTELPDVDLDGVIGLPEGIFGLRQISSGG